MHDRLQLRKHVLVRLWRVGVTSHGHLDDGQAHGPDVGRDRVGADVAGGFALYAFGLEAQETGSAIVW